MTPVPKPTPKPKAPRKPLRRTELKRTGSLLQRSGRIGRKTRLKVRGRSRFPKLRDALYTTWIRTLRCLVAVRCEGPVECAHVRTRGAGGADRSNCVPLCRRHHAEQHSIGIKSFQRKYNLDLAAEVALFDARYVHEQESQAA